MNARLSEELRKLRGLRGVSLREVERDTKISNAYLSQLETGKTDNPSPHMLHKLAAYYGTPYENLMEIAGYLQPRPASPLSQDILSSAEQLLSEPLTENEKRMVKAFVKAMRTEPSAESDT
jgi:transcriptional regulator with XRE-family HTH domain